MGQWQIEKDMVLEAMRAEQNTDGTTGDGMRVRSTSHSSGSALEITQPTMQIQHQQISGSKVDISAVVNNKELEAKPIEDI